MKKIFVNWFNNLSNRSRVITILICISLIYVSYTFNSCLITSLGRTLKNNPFRNIFKSSMLHVQIANVANMTVKDDINVTRTKTLYGMPLDSLLNKSATRILDGSPKYRLLRQQGSRPLRHLPDTLIIGVKKSGTRALLEFIRLHPDVRAAGCEVHFFDRHYQKGLHWYRHHMPYTIEGQITMEKTPSYFVTKEVPLRVHHMNANTKLLVVVRDPVTRAISDYTQAASKKTDMKRFEELAFVNGSYAVVDTNWGPVKIGVYARYLEKWLQFFQLSQLLFISGERLIMDPAYEIGRVQDFLGLKRVVTEKHFYFNSTKGFPCLFKSEARSTPHCLGKTKGRNHPHIETAAIERLRDFYRPFNNKFYEMTGINFAWP
ncbi:hypothetical protein FF38_04871 [Lucilia cuprina]|uniref:Sulfotransferase domain-containing protein n=1 Tax=Lucilia cuprina TaxID=7375 RepID=A0A0L0C8Q9_LUCCU|nr:Heparan sulfate glucosamine 3-O-sulfotransferase 3A1 [Lucilia cuprina]KNC28635.1 hypothetical protein FF38_04871 [Lucilia cuprina]